MPRIGQLLSALLVALIGVLVVQMFLLAWMHQQAVSNQPAPPVKPRHEVVDTGGQHRWPESG